MSNFRNMYKVNYTVWEKSDEACSKDGGHTGEQHTRKGFYQEPTEIDCVNAIVYELRGVKSEYELAYINEIQQIDDE